MKTLVLGATSGLAGCLAFAQAAIAGGMAYAPAPVVEDSGSDAGIYLLVGIAALLVIQSLNNPKPSAEPSADAPDSTE